MTLIESVVEQSAEGRCVPLQQAVATHKGNGNFLPDDTLNPAGCGKQTHTQRQLAHKHRQTQEVVCYKLKWKAGFLRQKMYNS